MLAFFSDCLKSPEQIKTERVNKVLELITAEITKLEDVEKPKGIIRQLSVRLLGSTETENVQLKYYRERRPLIEKIRDNTPLTTDELNKIKGMKLVKDYGIEKYAKLCKEVGLG